MKCFKRCHSFFLVTCKILLEIVLLMTYLLMIMILIKCYHLRTSSHCTILSCDWSMTSQLSEYWAVIGQLPPQHLLSLLSTIIIRTLLSAEMTKQNCSDLNANHFQHCLRFIREKFNDYYVLRFIRKIFGGMQNIVTL